MARWKLTHGHYLNVPGTEWEYKETDRTSGKQGRKVFPVPAYLNPDDASDCNYPGEIIVCYDGKGQGRDIVFEGPPTPDMDPLDDEARAISAEWAPTWVHPIESLPGQGYSQSILADFQKQMAAATSQPPVNKSEFEALKEQVSSLLKQNEELKARRV